LTLTARLSLFFLTTLGLVLIGFSAGFYYLARTYLHRQTGEGLDAAINTLIAATEIRAGEVEWEPAERTLHFSQGPFGEKVAWLVCDPQDRIIDSSGPGTEAFLGEASKKFADADSANGYTWQAAGWQFRQRWIHPVDGPKAQPEAVKSQPQAALIYPALRLAVGMPLEPMQANLRLIGWVLAGLSSAIWLLALVVGKIVCRRALLPVTQMALSARAIDPDDLTRRLPAVASGDELEELSQAFNSLLDRLQESLERQRRFTGDASHQLRTPLTAMLGQIEVALRRARSTEEYVRVLNTVQAETVRLRRIVESLLFLARANKDACLEELEEIDIGEWLKQYVSSLSENNRAEDIVLEAGNPDQLKVSVQSVLFRELMNILLDNACKYSPPGTPIRVIAQGDEKSVLVTVEDQGCGVAKEDLPSLTKPFFRSADSRRLGIDGMGLGLSIAKRTAEAFGGTLEIRSELGRGSAFIVKLPRARSSSSSVRNNQETTPVVSCPA
jgi:signal transduction histidine kinase